MEEFIPIAVLTAFIISVVNLLLYIKSKNWDGALKICVVWAAGILGVFLFAETDWASTIVIGDIALAAANFWTKVVMGLWLGGSATVVVEFKKAFDRNDSAVKPNLVGPPAG